MTKNLTVELDNELLQKFEMALSLKNEEKDKVIDTLLRSYISQAFFQAAAMYGSASGAASEQDKYFGKALHKIPKWSKKPKQAIYKIIRAYFQLSENGTVTYTDLIERCSDPVDHSDVYMAAFGTNFAQMKFDGEKSYGKVFEVTDSGEVVIWEYVKDQLLKYKQDFLIRPTDEGYVNSNKQKNIGKTDEHGTDHGQYLYFMRCGLCGHEYFANGSDIHLKKCPNCQSGADTGVTI